MPNPPTKRPLLYLNGYIKSMELVWRNGSMYYRVLIEASTHDGSLAEELSSRGLRLSTSPSNKVEVGVFMLGGKVKALGLKENDLVRFELDNDGYPQLLASAQRGTPLEVDYETHVRVGAVNFYRQGVWNEDHWKLPEPSDPMNKDSLTNLGKLTDANLDAQFKRLNAQADERIKEQTPHPAISFEDPMADWPFLVGIPAFLTSDRRRMRLGYTLLDVPLAQFSFDRRTQPTYNAVIRGAGGIKRGLGNSIETYNMSWMVQGWAEVKNGVVDVMNQFLHTPFIPVEGGPFECSALPADPASINKDEPESEPIIKGVDMLAVRSMTLSTVAGQPDAIQVTMNAEPFAWSQYCPTTDADRFDQAWCYPLYKLWCETRGRRSILTEDPLHGTHWMEGSLILSFPEEKTAEALALEISDPQDLVESLDGELLSWLEQYLFSGRSTVSGNVETGTRGELSRKKLAGGFAQFWSFNSSGLLGTELTSVVRLKIHDGKLFSYLARQAWAIGIIDSEGVSPRLERGGESSTPNQFTFGSVAGVTSLRAAFSANLPSDQTFGGDKYNEVIDLAQADAPGHPWQEWDLVVFIDFSSHTARELMQRLALDLQEWGVKFRDRLSNINTGDRYENLRALFDEAQSSDIQEKVIASPTGEGAVIESVTIERQNYLPHQQQRGASLPLHQYSGSSEALINIQGKVFSAPGLDMLKEIMELSDRLNRQPLTPLKKGSSPLNFRGFARIKNDVCQLGGVDFVIPLSLAYTALEDQPGAYHFTLMLAEFNPITQAQENLFHLPTLNQKNKTLISVAGAQPPWLETSREYFEIRNKLRQYAEVYPDMALPPKWIVLEWIDSLKRLVKRQPNQTPSQWSATDQQVYEICKPWFDMQAGGGWYSIFSTLITRLQRPGLHLIGVADPDFYVAYNKKVVGSGFANTLRTTLFETNNMGEAETMFSTYRLQDQDGNIIVFPGDTATGKDRTLLGSDQKETPGHFNMIDKSGALEEGDQEKEFFKLYLDKCRQMYDQLDPKWRSRVDQGAGGIIINPADPLAYEDPNTKKSKVTALEINDEVDFTRDTTKEILFFGEPDFANDPRLRLRILMYLLDKGDVGDRGQLVKALKVQRDASYNSNNDENLWIAISESAYGTENSNENPFIGFLSRSYYMALLKRQWAYTGNSQAEIDRLSFSFPSRYDLESFISDSGMQNYIQRLGSLYNVDANLMRAVITALAIKKTNWSSDFHLESALNNGSERIGFCYLDPAELRAAGIPYGDLTNIRHSVAVLAQYLSYLIHGAGNSDTRGDVTLALAKFMVPDSDVRGLAAYSALKDNNLTSDQGAALAHIGMRQFLDTYKAARDHQGTSKLPTGIARGIQGQVGLIRRYLQYLPGGDYQQTGANDSARDFVRETYHRWLVMSRFWGYHRIKSDNLYADPIFGIGNNLLTLDPEQKTIFQDNNCPADLICPNVTTWGSKTIQNASKDEEGNIQFQTIATAVDTQRLSVAQNPASEKAVVGMFKDMIENGLYGRFVRAFPTYLSLFIDEGNTLGNQRFWNHYYLRSGISEIDVHYSRKQPTGTAKISFSNLFGKLSAHNYLDSLHQQLLSQMRHTPATQNGKLIAGDVIKEGMTSIQEKFELVISNAVPSGMKNAWFQKAAALVMKPGVRLHLRMGYGADPEFLPVVFNGTISEVPVSESEVTVIALSDGAELTNPISHSLQQSSEGKLAFTHMGQFAGKEPAGILHDLFGPDWIASISGGRFGQKSRTGLSHFGDTWFSGIPNYNMLETQMNIYTSSPKLIRDYRISDNFFSTCSLYNYSDVQLIGVQILEATPWKTAEVCRRAVLDYIAYPMPFGFRSTLFFGKRWWPLYYDWDHPVIAAPNTFKIDKQQMAEEVNRILKTYFDNFIANRANVFGSDGSLDPEVEAVIEILGLAGDFRRLEISAQGVREQSAASFGFGGMQGSTSWYIPEDTRGKLNASSGITLQSLLDKANLIIAQLDPNSREMANLANLVNRVKSRSTFRLPWDSVEDLNKYTKWKPFAQLHVALGSDNLLASDVSATDENVYTNATGKFTYHSTIPAGLGHDSVHQTMIYSVDSDIVPHYQRTMLVDTGIYTNWMMEGTNSLIGISGLRDSLGMPATPQIRNAVVAALVDSVKEMYSGWFVLRGNPSIWPYHFLYVEDPRSSLNGLCGVREVIHHFSATDGFITGISPEALATSKSNQQELLSWQVLASYATRFASVYGMLSAVTLLRRGWRAFMRRGEFARLKEIAQALRDNLDSAVLKGVGAELGKAKAVKLEEFKTAEWEKRAKANKKELNAYIKEIKENDKYKQIASEVEEAAKLKLEQQVANIRKSVVTDIRKRAAKNAYETGSSLFFSGEDHEVRVVLEQMLDTLDDAEEKASLKYLEIAGQSKDPAVLAKAAKEAQRIKDELALDFLNNDRNRKILEAYAKRIGNAELDAILTEGGLSLKEHEALASALGNIEREFIAKHFPGKNTFKQPVQLSKGAETLLKDKQVKDRIEHEIKTGFTGKVNGAKVGSFEAYAQAYEEIGRQQGKTVKLAISGNEVIIEEISSIKAANQALRSFRFRPSTGKRIAQVLGNIRKEVETIKDAEKLAKIKAFTKFFRKATSAEGILSMAGAGQFEIVLAQMAWAAIQFFVVDTVFEFFNEFFGARQCVSIMPLKVGMNPMVAGILGHQGCVIGDEPGLMDQVITLCTDPQYFASLPGTSELNLGFDSVPIGTGSFFYIMSILGIQPHHYDNITPSDQRAELEGH